MTYRGHVQGGMVVIDDAANLADGTLVEISPVDAAKPASWADILKDVIGTAEGLPADSARSHDHHLYGTGKKE